ncbi:MAG: hypothetical protein WKG07_21280 [Hymenobacter sp.]
MRTFLTTKQLDNAKAVSDLLDKEVGLPEGCAGAVSGPRRLLLANRGAGQSHSAAGKGRAADAGQKRAPARSRFMLAQLYQQQSQNKEATAQLNNILKHNPAYELDFAGEAAARAGIGPG